MSLNLEKQLPFYGAYHHNTVGSDSTEPSHATTNNVVVKVNTGVHIACVPAILMTFLLLLTNTPSVPLPPWLSVPHLPLNGGTVAAVLFSLLYILMEPVAGAMLAPLLIGGTAYAYHLTSTYGTTANYWAGGINGACWIAQFVGHGKFEGRAPALLDNLVQALFLAPFFVWFEILFFLGYRPDLKHRVDKAIAQEVQKFKASKEKGAKVAANGSK
ncbi:hypothetical protein BDV95DRAFT_608839 [Massariosphaeria phaeospora]|uniref:DUF962 domain-containing protein n=1 Tax=Massariosphaeria phaeospora TaxID=100035 RepID=A0A7C8I7J7_9PLEO|nr:hypothetical protein BDV95DRAFT_608839 [Massariosphaeria phaeospora]